MWIHRWAKRSFRHRWAVWAMTAFMVTLARVLVPAVWITCWWTVTSGAYWGSV